MGLIKLKTTAIEIPGSLFATLIRDRSKPHRPHFLDPSRGGFCKLCGRQTEYEAANQNLRVYKRLPNGDAKEVKLTNSIRAKAKDFANRLVSLYEQAISGDLDLLAAEGIYPYYGILREMDAGSSAATFQDSVEQFALIIEWAKHGDLFGAPRLPSITSDAQRPSKLYCDLHNQHRGIESRRAYQRDTKFLAAYEEIIRQLWSVFAGRVNHGSFDDNALVRNAAYHVIRILKARTRVLEEHSKVTSPSRSQWKISPSDVKSIEDYYKVACASFHTLMSMTNESKGWLDDLQVNGITNQSKIAEKLEISRQAVSAALKKRKENK